MKAKNRNQIIKGPKLKGIFWENLTNEQFTDIYVLSLKIVLGEKRDRAFSLFLENYSPKIYDIPLLESMIDKLNQEERRSPDTIKRAVQLCGCRGYAKKINSFKEFGRRRKKLNEAYKNYVKNARRYEEFTICKYYSSRRFAGEVRYQYLNRIQLKLLLSKI